MDELRQANDPPRCSATGVGSTGYDIPRLLEDAFGTKFKVISGYPGGAEQDLAMERNEVHCRAITIDGFFGREPFITWLKKGFVRVWLQTEKQRHAKIPDVPTLFELMDQYKVPEAKRRLVNTYLGLWGFGSMPIVATPGVPARSSQNSARGVWEDRSQIRSSSKTLEKEVGTAAGERRRAAELAKEVVNQPPEVAAALKRILSQIICVETIRDLNRWSNSSTVSFGVYSIADRSAHHRKINEPVFRQIRVDRHSQYKILSMLRLSRTY